MAVITLVSNKTLKVHGKDLRLARYNKGLSLLIVCQLMDKKGYCYYPMKLYRLEHLYSITFPVQEVLDLLECLSAAYAIT